MLKQLAAFLGASVCLVPLACVHDLGNQPGQTGAGNSLGTGTTGAGATTGRAGTTGTGTTGSAGVTGSGATTGGAGSTGAAGTGAPATSSMIDNLDDGDGRILMADGRQGPWHVFNDQNGGNQQPPFNGPFVAQSGGANNTPMAAHTTGNGYQYGGIGFDLNNTTNMPESSSSHPYDASAYNGIRFWAKGDNAKLRVELAQRSFVPTDRGGSCAAAPVGTFTAAARSRRRAR